jgi:hypothetical protein
MNGRGFFESSEAENLQNGIAVSQDLKTAGKHFPVAIPRNNNIYDVLVGDEVKKDEMGGACNTHGRDEICIQILVRKPEGKSPLGRPRHRWEMILE